MIIRGHFIGPSRRTLELAKMPSIKVSPPERLPEGSMTEQQFQTFKTELKVYLMLEDNFRPYITGKNKEWEAACERVIHIFAVADDSQVGLLYHGTIPDCGRKKRDSPGWLEKSNSRPTQRGTTTR